MSNVILLQPLLAYKFRRQIHPFGEKIIPLRACSTLYTNQTYHASHLTFQVTQLLASYSIQSHN